MSRRLLALAAGGLLVLLLSAFAINTDAGSDPRLTLAVSQALVETGQPFLDPWVGTDILGRPFDQYVATGHILSINGRHVHYFPLGPSVISAPVVGIGRLLGLDMFTEDNYRLQGWLAAVTVVLVYLLAYALASAYLDFTRSLVLALVTVLGSTLISTLGTALWSHNYAVLCTGGALLLIVREAQGKSARLFPVLLGLLLFLAFLNRPSSVAFIVPALGYLLWRSRAASAGAALTSGLLLAGYLLWNWATLGVVLPEYFSPERLEVMRAPVWVGVIGNLISPSRGLLVFSPLLLPVLVGYVLYWRTLLARPIVWLCLVWLVLQLVIVARAASWWGGWSFGPRLMTDVWPGLIVLTAILWAYLLASGSDRAARTFTTAFLLLGFVAAALHIIQGLYSQPASRWNSFITPLTPPDTAPLSGDLFNWRYAQPLATSGMLCRIEREAVDVFPETPPLWPLRLGQTVPVAATLTPQEIPGRTPAGNAPPAAANHGLPAGAVDPYAYLPMVTTPGGFAAFFVGWSEVQRYGEDMDVRWSTCPTAEIELRLDGQIARDFTGTEIMLHITGVSNGPQEVAVAINGRPVGTMHWTGAIEGQTLSLPASLLMSDDPLRLTLSFPDAHAPNIRDQRPLGLALGAFTLRDAARPLPPPQPVESPAAYPAP